MNVTVRLNRNEVRRLAATTTMCAGCLWSATAAAHIRMDEPVARNEWAMSAFQDPIKDGPCGSGANDPRSTDPDKINEFSPGQEITVSWHETIDHPGHYRIAIDMDGQDDFVDKTGETDIVDPPVLPVLLDGILDQPGGAGTYSVTVKLPNETCDNCTLQLIQYMTDTYESYYVCADLVISGTPVGGDGDGDSGTTESTTDSSTTGIEFGSGGAASASTGGGPSTGGTMSGTGGTLGAGAAAGVTGGTTGTSPAGGAATYGETGDAYEPSGTDSAGTDPQCALVSGPTVPVPGGFLSGTCFVGVLGWMRRRHRQVSRSPRRAT